MTYRPIAGTRGWVHYVHVASLDDAMAAAQRLGASMLRPKTAVPKSAWYAVLADPEGNAFAIYQPGPDSDASAGAGIAPEKRWPENQDGCGQGPLAR